jgi:hypothetical protein
LTVRVLRATAVAVAIACLSAIASGQETAAGAGRDAPRYFLESVEIRGNTRTPKSEIRPLVPFEVGETFVTDDPRIEETRVRLLTTGYFLDVELSLRRGRRRGWVVLVVRVEERNTLHLRRLFAGHSRSSTYGGLDVGDSNLFGHGTSLSAAAVLSDDAQQAFRVRFGERRFLGSPFTLSTIVSHTDGREYFGTGDVLSSVCSPALDHRCRFATVYYRRTGIQIGAARDLGLSLRLDLGMRVEVIDAEVPDAASTRVGREVIPVDFDIASGASSLVTSRAGLQYDTRNAPFLPSRGVGAGLGVEATSLPGAYEFARLTLSGEAHVPLPWNHHVGLYGLGGVVLGDAPFFEQFYLGDLTDLIPDRSLDLSFNDLAAPNLLDTAIVEMRYEEIAARLEVEYVVPVYRSRGFIYGLDAFARGGVIALASHDYVRDTPAGYEGMARFPADVTFNVGVRADSEIGFLGLSFANVLQFVPEGIGQ